MNGLKQREQEVSSKNDFECYFKHSAQCQIFRTDFVVEGRLDYWLTQTFNFHPCRTINSVQHVIMGKTIAFHCSNMDVIKLHNI